MKKYIVRATLPSDDWDRPDSVLEKCIFADNWEEAVEIATNLCCISDKDLESFINGDGDYSHVIDPYWTTWRELTWNIVNADYEGMIPSSVTLEECSPKSQAIPLVEACQAQNKMIREAYEKKEKMAKLKKLKKELGV